MPEGDVALWRRIRRRWYWLLALVLIGVAKVLDQFQAFANGKYFHTLDIFHVIRHLTHIAIVGESISV